MDNFDGPFLDETVCWFDRVQWRLSGVREFEKARQIVGLADFEYALLAARSLETSPVGNRLMRLRLIAANDCNLNYFACWKYQKRKKILAYGSDVLYSIFLW